MGNNTMSSIHQNNGLHNVAHTQNTQGNSINSNSIPQTANNNSQIPNSPNTAFPPQVARLHTPNTNNEHNNNTNWGSSGGANSNQFPSSNSRLQNPHFSPSAGGDEQHPYARPGYQNVYPLENNNAYDFSPMNKALPNATTQMPNGNMANMSNGGILPNGHMSNGNLPKGAVPMSSNILQNLPATVQSPNDSHILNTKQMQTPVSAGYSSTTQSTTPGSLFNNNTNINFQTSDSSSPQVPATAVITATNHSGMLSDLSLKQQNSHVEDHSATSSMNGNDRPAASSTGSGLAITEFVPGRDKWEGTAKDKEFDPFGSNNYDDQHMGSIPGTVTSQSWATPATSSNSGYKASSSLWNTSSTPSNNNTVNGNSGSGWGNNAVGNGQRSWN